MNLLLIFPGFIIAFAIVLYYEYKIKNLSKNNVHFYVARDLDDTLWFFLGKPYRNKDKFVSGDNCVLIGFGDSHLKEFGLNKEDFKDLKWEDGPAEVFINMED